MEKVTVLHNYASCLFNLLVELVPTAMGRDESYPSNSEDSLYITPELVDG